MRTLFAITRDSNLPGEFPPVFPGTTTTLARLFRRSQRHFASNSGNFRANSAQFVTDSRGHHYRPRPRLFRPAGRLSPPPFPPAAGRLARPACLAVRPRGHPRGEAGAGRGGRWGADRYIHGEGHHRENKYRSSFAWRADYDCFTSCARILVWEFTRRFIPGTACAFPGSGGYRCRQVDVKEYGIAGGKERPPVRLSRGGAPPRAARGLRLSRGGDRGTGAMPSASCPVTRSAAPGSCWPACGQAGPGAVTVARLRPRRRAVIATRRRAAGTGPVRVSGCGEAHAARLRAWCREAGAAALARGRMRRAGTRRPAGSGRRA